MNIQLTATDWLLSGPMFWLAGAALAILLLDAVRPVRPLETLLGILGLVGAGFSCIPIWNAAAQQELVGFSSMLRVSPALVVLGIVCIGAAVISGVLACKNLLNYEQERHTTAFWTLVLFSVLGMLLTLWANHMVTLFLGIETLSIPLYVLSALRRQESDSIEAGVKYFLLGAFASGFLAFGMALLYAATGEMTTAAILAAPEAGGLAVFGLGMMLISLLFKVAAAPFHLWVADVYQGSPTAVTTLMATGTKTATAAALLRWAPGSETLGPETWAILACLTLILGNFTALNQTNLKRMLALSGVAHVGILLFALAARAAGSGDEQTWQAISFYLVAYGLAATAGFGALEMLERRSGGTSDDEVLRGLARQYPLLGGVLCIALLSLAGVPLTAGFLAKYFVFVQLLRADLVGWAVIGILLTLLGFAYYLRALITLFMKEPLRQRAVPNLADDWIAAVLLIPAVLSVVLGVWPNTIGLG